MIEFKTKQELSTMNVDEKINLFKDLLKSTNRSGVDQVIEKLEGNDFFKAPASTKFHSNCESGLLDHSLMVCFIALKIHESLKSLNSDYNVQEDHVIISALLHDICKCNFYKTVIKNRKNEDGQWEQYNTYCVEESFPFGHGEKSVLLLQAWGLKMKMDELLAIRWHMANWDNGMSDTEKYSFNNSVNKYPLVSIIACADYLSSMNLETIFVPNAI